MLPQKEMDPSSGDLDNSHDSGKMLYSRILCQQLKMHFDLNLDFLRLSTGFLSFHSRLVCKHRGKTMPALHCDFRGPLE